MSYLDLPNEHHFQHRTGWLRAAVLGANDGIVSTASLIIGVASASANSADILIAGLAALVAGAMSMAAGEYVSVSSQSDTEKADLATELAALESHPEEELLELASIYEKRGVEPELAREVARQMMAQDALGTHARDELGMSGTVSANPLQAALFSAVSFAGGAALPLAGAALSPQSMIIVLVSFVSLAALTLLGVFSAQAGGANRMKAVARVVFWGVAAMAMTGLVGHLFGTVV